MILLAYNFDWYIVTDRWRLFVAGAWVDLSVAVIGVALGRVHTSRYVSFPQPLRIATPPLRNTFVGLLKGATIMAPIAVPDLVFPANEPNVTLFTPFELFAAVAVVLLVMVLFFSAIV